MLLNFLRHIGEIPPLLRPSLRHRRADSHIQDQLHHGTNEIMTGMHDVFTPDKDDKEDAISLKKILKKEAVWETIKNVLGFEFDGNPREHTIWLTEDRRTGILTQFEKVD